MRSVLTFSLNWVETTRRRACDWSAYRDLWSWSFQILRIFSSISLWHIEIEFNTLYEQNRFFHLHSCDAVFVFSNYFVTNIRIKSEKQIICLLMFWEHHWKLIFEIVEMRAQLRHELFWTLFQLLKLLIDVKHAKFLRRDMFLKNILKKFSERILNKKIVFSTLNVEDVICESHLRILNMIDVHAIRYETYFDNLNTFFKKDVEFMLILCLLKIEIFYQLLAFVTKNIFKRVFRSQRKFRKTRRFCRACVWHFAKNANDVFFEDISRNWRSFTTKATWCVVW
jgi:hypothetical protein